VGGRAQREASLVGPGKRKGAKIEKPAVRRLRKLAIKHKERDDGQTVNTEHQAEVLLLPSSIRTSVQCITLNSICLATLLLLNPMWSCPKTRGRMKYLDFLDVHQGLYISQVFMIRSCSFPHCTT
jgi:hypothetical protein